MYSYIALALAEERARDLQSAAAQLRHRRQARQSGKAARGGWPARHAEVSKAPDSYEDFLCQTAGSALREPVAHSGGRAVH